MEIVYLKTGPFSMHPVYGPVVNCIAGVEAELRDDYAKQLIDYNWACEKGGHKSPPPPPPCIDSNAADDCAEDVVDEPVPPWEKPAWNPTRVRAAKNELEDYAREAYGLDIDRRKSVKNIIAEIESVEG